LCEQITFENLLLDFQTKIEQSFLFHINLVKSVPIHVEIQSAGQKSLEQKVMEDTVCKELQAAISTGLPLYFAFHEEIAIIT
jgi:hypothetical protein